MCAGQLFNDTGYNSPIVKASTAIDKLGSTVLKARCKGRRVLHDETGSEDDDDGDGNSEDNDADKGNLYSMSYTLGAKILEWVIDFGVLELVDSPMNYKVVAKSGEFFTKKNLYVRCSYDLRLLPAKLNLPMVVRPKPWTIAVTEKKNGKVRTVLEGGYLAHSVDALYRFHLQSSKNLELLKLRLNLKSRECLKGISALQDVAFRIDEAVLDFRHETQEKTR